MNYMLNSSKIPWFPKQKPNSQPNINPRLSFATVWNTGQLGQKKQLQHRCDLVEASNFPFLTVLDCLMVPHLSNLFSWFWLMFDMWHPIFGHKLEVPVFHMGQWIVHVSPNFYMNHGKKCSCTSRHFSVKGALRDMGMGHSKSAPLHTITCFKKQLLTHWHPSPPAFWDVDVAVIHVCLALGDLNLLCEAWPKCPTAQRLLCSAPSVAIHILQVIGHFRQLQSFNRRLDEERRQSRIQPVESFAGSTEPAIFSANGKQLKQGAQQVPDASAQSGRACLPTAIRINMAGWDK